MTPSTKPSAPSSPCCKAAMFGGDEMLCCFRCSRWYKTKEVRQGEFAEMMKKMGIDPDSIFK